MGEGCEGGDGHTGLGGPYPAREQKRGRKGRVACHAGVQQEGPSTGQDFCGSPGGSAATTTAMMFMPREGGDDMFWNMLSPEQENWVMGAVEGRQRGKGVPCHSDQAGPPHRRPGREKESLETSS